MGNLQYLGTNYHLTERKLWVVLKNLGDFTEAKIKVCYYENNGLQGCQQKYANVDTNQQVEVEFIPNVPDYVSINKVIVQVTDARTKQFIIADTIDLSEIPVWNITGKKLESEFPQVSEPKVSIPKQQKEMIDLEIGFLNPVNWTAELLENIKNWINNIANAIGWNCYSVIGNGNKLTLRFEKLGSPALPIMAIIMVVAILTGAIIVSVSWKAVRLAEEETKQELAKLEQLKTNKDLLELVTDEYNRGLIDEETYKDLLIQMGYSNVNITKPKPSEEKEGFGWEDIPEIAAGFVPLAFLFLLISLVKK